MDFPAQFARETDPSEQRRLALHRCLLMAEPRQCQISIGGQWCQKRTGFRTTEDQGRDLIRLIRQADRPPFGQRIAQ